MITCNLVMQPCIYMIENLKNESKNYLDKKWMEFNTTDSFFKKNRSLFLCIISISTLISYSSTMESKGIQDERLGKNVSIVRRGQRNSCATNIHLSFNNVRLKTLIMNWEFSKAILRNNAWKNVFKEARPHRNQNIGISSQKLYLRLWLLVTQQKLLWIIISRRDSCPSEWTQREEL